MFPRVPRDANAHSPIVMVGARFAASEVAMAEEASGNQCLQRSIAIAIELRSAGAGRVSASQVAIGDCMSGERQMPAKGTP